MTDDKNGWGEYRFYVVEELKRLNGLYQSIDDKVGKIVWAVIAAILMGALAKWGPLIWGK